MQRFKDKVTVITGGNSGIGKGIAEYFSAQGSKLVIFGRNETTLAETKASCPGECLTVQGDVTNSNDLKKLYHEVHQCYGKIDSLIVNSGVAERLHVKDVTEEKFDYMVDINYRGAYFTVKYALDFMNSPASIIFIASCSAFISLPRHSVYASAKAAITKLAKNLAVDLAADKIRVNSISPGYIQTPIFEERLKSDPDYLKRREAIIPLQRIGTPLDIAQAALFLASDESSYITGTDILVDGGLTNAYPENQNL